MASEAVEITHVARTLGEQLPALQVVVPMVATPLIVLLGGRVLGWVIAFLATAIATLVSILLMLQVMDGSFISYTMGGWVPPIGS